MPVVAIVNPKSGAGKTATALNLGAALKEAGKRVLVVDLDPRASLTIAGGLANAGELALTIGDLLLASAVRGNRGMTQTLRDAIVQAPAGLELVPSNARLVGAELAMVSALGRELMLRVLLRPVVKGYDYVLLDCPPNLGLVVANALSAADGVIIPVQAALSAVSGLGQLLEAIAAVQERLNPDLVVYGLLLTTTDQRSVPAREVAATIRQHLEGQVHIFDAELRPDAALAESLKAGRSVLAFDGGSDAAGIYRNLAVELLRVTGAAVPVAAPSVSIAGSTASGAIAAPVPAQTPAPDTAPVVLHAADTPMAPPPATGPPATPAVDVGPAAPAPRPAPPPAAIAADVIRRTSGASETAGERRAEAAGLGPAHFADFVARKREWLGGDLTPDP
ncbi:MAG: ParA family protein [Chloroflexi bacterium]|nr:ParA family protein [Chloroflexota bacterium]